MYELSIAAKYLTPRWRQLSVSIISIISILVIAVVVWLIVVFFSVTTGLTEGWLDKLTALTSPVRLTPTKAYYDSYYYMIDSVSSASDYANKTISEKLESSLTNPYDPTIDSELPTHWRQPDLDENGLLKDPVKIAFSTLSTIHGIKGLSASEYESNAAKLHLRLWRKPQKNIPDPQKREIPQGYLSQGSIFGSLDPQNPWLLKAIVPPSMPDLSNLLSSIDWEASGFEGGETFSPTEASKLIIQERLKTFFEHVNIQQLSVGPGGWQLPSTLLPQNVTWDVVALIRGERIIRLIIPPNRKTADELLAQKKWQGFVLEKGQLQLEGKKFNLQIDGQQQNLAVLPKLFIPTGTSITASLIPESIEQARHTADVAFNGSFDLQGTPIQGIIHYNNLNISAATLSNRYSETPTSEPFWLYAKKNDNDQILLQLPSHNTFGSGVLLPRGFRDSGLMIGDTGSIIYPTASPTGIRDEHVPVFIAGFYDPGIIPIGGKYIIANSDVVTQLRAPINHDETLIGNGINVRFSDRNAADKVKIALQKAFEEAGISEYWKIQTFKEFEFTRDVIQQLQSDRHLFSLISALIIIVACSNIISMLIILVNDKKSEIGILRSMGASSLSIGLIFGSCGVFIGVMGGVIGTIAAMITLKYLQPLVSFISWMQGYEMFNPLFYGENLPTELNYETLMVVITTTAVISLMAGIIPAIKASLLKPAAILKAE